MSVNIERAEEIINYGFLKTHHKKNHSIQKKLLNQVIKQVKEKQKTIQIYFQTVKILSDRYKEKRKQLQDLFHQLDEREHNLNHSLTKIQYQQKELEHHRKEVEDELQNLRSRAEVCREKRARYEHNYHTVASVPFFASQSKKRYIKARDKNSEIEQQISEKRQTLDKCREHLKLISKAVAAQQAERSQLLTERERSLNALHSSQQQLNELKEGCEFWSNFDSYQAQVVLESAIYLRDLLEGDNTIKEKKKKKKGKKDAASEDNVLDINEVWIKTFRLACFEYGDHELYGDMHWSLTSLQIYFDCGLCEIYQVGWPKMMTLNHITELACELCYSTILNKQQHHHLSTAIVDTATATTVVATAIATTHNGSLISSDTLLKTQKVLQSNNGHSKMKKMMSVLFNYNPSKINPIIM